jgi:hypothetical protein
MQGRETELTAYEATAANLQFYQRLVVLAADADAAHDLFTAYLAAPEQQAEEEEEYAMAVQADDDEIIGGTFPRREFYIYCIDSDVKEFTGDRHLGDADSCCQVMSAGGNG